MQIYETDDDYSSQDIEMFKTFLDDNIGTEYEVNSSGSGHPDEYYIMVFDLTSREVGKIMKYENQFKKRR